MMDIVERLRSKPAVMREPDDICLEAANTIEHLLALNASLTEGADEANAAMVAVSKEPIWTSPDPATIKHIRAALFDIQEELDLRRSDLVSAALTALADMAAGYQESSQ